jgi:hypothetical protein
MEKLAHGDPIYGYMFERSWMHLFGEPFLRLPPLTKEREAEHHRTERAVDLRP